MEDLRVQLISIGAHLSEEDLLEQALNNLPKEDELILSKLEDHLGNETIL